MYTTFYNLTEKPFNLTPSPRYLYLGEVHKEALAFLTYGVVERKGFIVLTGEVGTGKTTMVQTLLANLDENVETVYISNPMLSDKDFIDYLAFSAFKRKVRFKSKADFLVEFEQFLKECLKNQRTFLLIVDEAQRLSFSLLEEIRLLSNMETADEKLINIFLVGQPELNEKLAEPRCRALLQRVSVRHHIRPLDLEETREYVMTRLKIAGAHRGEKIFPKSSIKALHQYSEGYPRMINILADNALLLGYSREKKKITPEMIRECYEDIRPKFNKEITGPKENTIKKAAVQEKRGSATRGWKWAILFVALMALGMVGAANWEDISAKLNRFLTIVSHHGSEPLGEPQSASLSPKVTIRTQLPQPEKIEPKQSGAIDKQTDTIISQPENMVESEITENQGASMGHPVTEPEPEPEREDLAAWPVRFVKAGDTLAQLAIEVYGYADQKILELIQKSNPEITDIDLINVGQRIVFPPASAKKAGPTYTVYVASYSPFSAARQEFQRLSTEGYEVYILPAYDPEKGKIYRIALGNFNKLEKAQEYAATLVAKGVTSYAKPIRLEVK